MSELINTRNTQTIIRSKLLTGVSALALTVYVSSANMAKAEDADRPTVWIELGGQMENASGLGANFAPGFLTAYPGSPVIWKGVSPLEAQHLPLSFGDEGRISLQPKDSDWSLTAAVQYGRSGNRTHVHHQTSRVFTGQPGTASQIAPPKTDIERFADTKADGSESHLIADFSVGKDVGLGLFGSASSSTIDIGVRFAQFASRKNIDLRARPDFNITKYFNNFPIATFHNYYVVGQASRSFHGLGPMLSWNNSMPFAGSTQDGEIAMDWGVNAGVLFGKQSVQVLHHESAQKFHGFPGIGKYSSVYNHTPLPRDEKRSVTVPNVGGFAGLSYRYSDAKISVGYRADLFVNAMDTGIDASNSSNVLFHGPYATVSIGLGG